MWVQLRFNIPQYQIPSLQRPNLYPAFQNTPQRIFSQVFQSRFRNNQHGKPFNPDNQIIPKMNQSMIGTVSGLTQPTIEYPTAYQENSRESGQQNSKENVHY